MRVAAIRFPVPFGPKSINKRLRFLSPIYKLIRYHRLIFDSVADGVFRSTYPPWLDSITFIKGRGKGGNRTTPKQQLRECLARVKRASGRTCRPAEKPLFHSPLPIGKAVLGGPAQASQCSYFAENLGLEDVKDNSGKVVQDGPLELWANVKQRALDHALREINKQSDIHLEIEFVGRGAFRKVLSLGFRITARKNGGKGKA